MGAAGYTFEQVSAEMGQFCTEMPVAVLTRRAMDQMVRDGVVVVVRSPVECGKGDDVWFEGEYRYLLITDTYFGHRFQYSRTSGTGRNTHVLRDVFQKARTFFACFNKHVVP